MVFQYLALIIPGAVDGFQLQIPFGGLDQNLGRHGAADLAGDDVDPVTGRFGFQKVEDPVNGGGQGVGDLAGDGRALPVRRCIWGRPMTP